jgi:hypothetical protein
MACKRGARRGIRSGRMGDSCASSVLPDWSRNLVQPVPMIFADFVHGSRIQTREEWQVHGVSGATRWGFKSHWTGLGARGTVWGL